VTTAAPERARWPQLAAAPPPPLRSLLRRGYAGFTEVTTGGTSRCRRGLPLEITNERRSIMAWIVPELLWGGSRDA